MSLLCKLSLHLCCRTQLTLHLDSLLALSSPELLVVAISVTHGNCTRDAAVANLHKTFGVLEQHLQKNPADRHLWPGVDLERRKQLGVGPIEVMLGSDGPIKGEPVTAKYFHGL